MAEELARISIETSLQGKARAMFIGSYMYLYICIPVCMYIRMYVYRAMLIGSYKYLYICILVYMYVCIHTYIRMYVYIYVYIYIYIDIDIYLHIKGNEAQR